MCVVGEGVEEHKITINCEILFFSGQRQHKTTVSVYSGLVLHPLSIEILGSFWDGM